MDDIKKTSAGRRSTEVSDTPAGRIFVPAHDNAPILEGYLTEAELAKELGRSIRTIARWRSIGEGPPWVVLGRQVLYRKTSVTAWLAGLECDA